MKRIESFEELKRLATSTDFSAGTEVFISLNGGVKSSKRVTYFPDTNTFDIYNDIDGSYEEDLTEEQLRSLTHIVVAIENDALFLY